MLQINETPAGNPDLAQAAELSLLVDLEASWENMRKPALGREDTGATSKDLSAKQKAYEAFRTKMAAYNSRYRPAHVPELLLNTPFRLGTWCRTMRSIYLQLAHDPQCHCPVHLLEKAYRWANKIGVRMNKSLVSPTTPPATIADAIKELEDLATWCDDAMGAAPSAEMSVAPSAVSVGVQVAA